MPGMFKPQQGKQHDAGPKAYVSAGRWAIGGILGESTPPDRPIRTVQYSQARDSGPGVRFAAAASFVSPRVNGPRVPIASARIWYSAFWHIAIERKTSSRRSRPTTDAP